MKKFLLATIALCLFLLPSATHAIDLGGGLARGAAEEAGFDPGTDETTFAETLGGVVKSALSFVGVIFLALMVYAGYLWMTAAGEEDKINKAQKMIRGAIIGLIITVGAYSITSFVVPRIIERTTAGSSQSSSAEPRVPCCMRCNAPGANPGECQFTTAQDANACNQLCSIGGQCTFVNLPQSQCAGTRRP